MSSTKDPKPAAAAASKDAQHPSHEARISVLEASVKNLATKRELDAAVSKLATKEELAEAVSKLATKEEIKPLATREEVKDIVHEANEKLRKELRAELGGRMDRLEDAMDRGMRHQLRILIAVLILWTSALGVGGTLAASYFRPTQEVRLVLPASMIPQQAPAEPAPLAPTGEALASED